MAKYRRLMLVAMIVAGLGLADNSVAATQAAQTDDIAARYGNKPRIMFTAVPVSDVERAIKFFSEVTGAVVKRERRRTDFAEIFMGFPDDPRLAPTIMLIWRGGPPAADAQRARLAFESVDAAAAAERARAAGGTVVRAATRNQANPVIIAVVQDPDGNQVELVQYAPTRSP